MTALDTYSGQFKLFDGTLDVTTGYGVRYSVASSNDCSVSIDSSGNYTVSAVTADTANAIFRALYNGASIYKTFTISKSRGTGSGTAKRVVLATTAFSFIYDESNHPATASATVTVNKFNTTADTVWNIKKLDETVISTGTADSLVSGGYITSSANANQLVINQDAFDNLIKNANTNVIIIEAVVTDGLTVMADRITLCQLIQRSKVTWENISDPNGTKAQVVKNAKDAAYVSSILDRAIDDVLSRQIQTASSLHVNIRRVEEDTANQFTIEQTAREALGVSLDGVSANLTSEIATRAGADTALSSSITTLSSSLSTTNSNVATISSNLTTESSARVSADNALSANITTLYSNYGTISANLTTEAATRASADSSLSSLYSSLSASLGTTNANLSSETTARVSADSALTATATTLTNRINNIQTGVTIEAFANSITTAVSSEASTRASQDTALQADYNGQIGTINSSLSTQVSKMGVVENRWTLALNAGGNAVAGLVLANGSNSQSLFAVQADKFAIYDSSGSGTSPFYVSSGQTYIQSATIPLLAVTTGKIDNLAVTTGKIANLAVDTLQIAGNAVTIPTGAYTAGTVTTTNGSWTDIQSVTYTSTGAPVAVFLMAQLGNNTGGYSNGWQFRIARNGTVIITVASNTLLGSNGGLGVPVNIIDTPSAGSVTYTAQCLCSAAYPVLNRSLICLELKK